MDLGITTYGFLLLNCFLLIIGLIRVLVAICLTIVSVFIFSHLHEASFTPMISDAVFVGINEEAIFLLGILAGFKNNTRLLFTYQFFIVLLAVSKILSLQEASRNELILKEDIKLSLEDLMNDYRFNGLNANKVEDIQYFFSCCGFHGPQFWLKSVSNSSITKLPDSCCPGQVAVCELDSAWKVGCHASMVSKLPNMLFGAHYYTLYPLTEMILFFFGILLIVFIRKTAANSLA